MKMHMQGKSHKKDESKTKNESPSKDEHLDHSPRPGSIPADSDLAAIFESLQGTKIMEHWQDLKLPMHPLLLATTLGNTVGIQKLLSAGVDINLQDTHNGDTALHCAAAANQVTAIDILILEGADPAITNKDGNNPLMVAILKNKLESFRALWTEKDKFDINHANKVGNTALHLAAEKGANFMLGVLLRIGANINARCHEGNTPLVSSSTKGNFMCARLLIEHRADILFENDKLAGIFGNMTAVCSAVTQNKHDVANLLVECLVKSNQIDTYIKRRIDILKTLQADDESHWIFFNSVLLPTIYLLWKNTNTRKYLQLYNFYEKIVSFGNSYLDMVPNIPDDDILEEIIYHIRQFMIHPEDGSISELTTKMFLDNKGPEVIIKALNRCCLKKDSVHNFFYLTALFPVVMSKSGKTWLRENYHRILPSVSSSMNINDLKELEEDHGCTHIQDELKSLQLRWQKFQQVFKSVQTSQSSKHYKELLALEKAEKEAAERKKHKRDKQKNKQSSDDKKEDQESIIKDTCESNLGTNDTDPPDSMYNFNNPFQHYSEVAGNYFQDNQLASDRFEKVLTKKERKNKNKKKESCKPSSTLIKKNDQNQISDQNKKNTIHEFIVTTKLKEQDVSKLEFKSNTKSCVRIKEQDKHTCTSELQKNMILNKKTKPATSKILKDKNDKSLVKNPSNNKNELTFGDVINIDELKKNSQKSKKQKSLKMTDTKDTIFFQGTAPQDNYDHAINLNQGMKTKLPRMADAYKQESIVTKEQKVGIIEFKSKSCVSIKEDAHISEVQKNIKDLNKITRTTIGSGLNDQVLPESLVSNSSSNKNVNIDEIKRKSLEIKKQKSLKMTGTKSSNVFPRTSTPDNGDGEINLYHGMKTKWSYMADADKQDNVMDSGRNTSIQVISTDQGIAHSKENSLPSEKEVYEKSTRHVIPPPIIKSLHDFEANCRKHDQESENIYLWDRVEESGQQLPEFFYHDVNTRAVPFCTIEDHFLTKPQVSSKNPQIKNNYWKDGNKGTVSTFIHQSDSVDILSEQDPEKKAELLRQKFGLNQSKFLLDFLKQDHCGLFSPEDMWPTKETPDLVPDKFDLPESFTPIKKDLSFEHDLDPELDCSEDIYTFKDWIKRNFHEEDSGFFDCTDDFSKLLYLQRLQAVRDSQDMNVTAYGYDLQWNPFEKLKSRKALEQKFGGVFELSKRQVRQKDDLNQNNSSIFSGSHSHYDETTYDVENNTTNKADMSTEQLKLDWEVEEINYKLKNKVDEVSTNMSETNSTIFPGSQESNVVTNQESICANDSESADSGNLMSRSSKHFLESLLGANLGTSTTGLAKANTEQVKTCDMRTFEVNNKFTTANVSGENLDSKRENNTLKACESNNKDSRDICELSMKLAEMSFTSDEDNTDIIPEKISAKETDSKISTGPFGGNIFQEQKKFVEQQNIQLSYQDSTTQKFDHSSFRFKEKCMKNYSTVDEACSPKVQNVKVKQRLCSSQEKIKNIGELKKETPLSKIIQKIKNIQQTVLHQKNQESSRHHKNNASLNTNETAEHHRLEPNETNETSVTKIVYDSFNNKEDSHVKTKLTKKQTQKPTKTEEKNNIKKLTIHLTPPKLGELVILPEKDNPEETLATMPTFGFSTVHETNSSFKTLDRHTAELQLRTTAKNSYAERRMFLLHLLRDCTPSSNYNKEPYLMLQHGLPQWSKWKSSYDQLINILPAFTFQVGNVIIPKYLDKFKLGNGSRLTVVTLGHTTNSEVVAVKRLLKSQHLGIIQEAKTVIQKKLSHPNILPILEMLDDSSYIYMLSPVCECNLDVYLQNLGESTDHQHMQITTKLCKGMLKGLGYLHIQGLSHGNLTPKNILIDCFGSVRLSDYSIWESRKDSSQQWRSTDNITQDSTFEERCGADKQVMGMLMYYTLTSGQHPYGERKFEIEVNMTRCHPKLKRITPDVDNLMPLLMAKDPNQRLSVIVALFHPLFMEDNKKASFIQKMATYVTHKLQSKSSLSEYDEKLITYIQQLNLTSNIGSLWKEKVPIALLTDFYDLRERTEYDDGPLGFLEFVHNVHVLNDLIPKDSLENIVRGFPTLCGEVFNLLRQLNGDIFSDTNFTSCLQIN